MESQIWVEMLMYSVIVLQYQEMEKIAIWEIETASNLTKTTMQFFNLTAATQPMPLQLQYSMATIL